MKKNYDPSGIEYGSPEMCPGSHLEAPRNRICPSCKRRLQINPFGRFYRHRLKELS